MPTVMLLCAVGSAIGFVGLDAFLHGMSGDQMPWFGAMQAEAARKILATTASTMVTVAGVVFSITIVALQLASSQYGPSLLRNFMTDLGNQIVLGTFVSAFLYCLLVLAAVRDDPRGFVPVAATWMGVAFGVAGIGVLVFFIHHIAQSIRIENIVARVVVELDRSVDALFREDRRGAPVAPPAPPPDDVARRGRPVLARRAGYIRSIDEDGMLGLAAEHDLIVVLEHRPGDFIVADGVLGHGCPAEHVTGDVAAAIAGCIAIGPDRTPLQDIGYVLRQLVQIALRALSPAVNDTFTAMECINRLGEGLHRAARRCPPSPHRFDANGHLRIVTPQPTLALLVVSAFDPIARAAAGNGDILALLLKAVGLVGRDARDENDRDALRDFARHLEQEGNARLGRERDRWTVAQAYAECQRRLDRRSFSDAIGTTLPRSKNLTGKEGGTNGAEGRGNEPHGHDAGRQ